MMSEGVANPFPLTRRCIWRDLSLSVPLDVVRLLTRTDCASNGHTEEIEHEAGARRYLVNPK